MTNRFVKTIIVVLGYSLFSCLEQSDDSIDSQTFNSVFDNKQFTTEVSPIDVQETADGGYLILAERRLATGNFRGVYLLKADKYGKFVNELKLDDNFVNPVGNLRQVDNQFMFLCMDVLDLETRVVKIDENLTSPEITTLNGLTYPAAFSADGTTGLLLSYNHDDKAMILSTINLSALTIGQSTAFDIGVGDEVEEPIINHFIRTGRQFPFQVGRIPNGAYYFNGFYNYTFSLVFTNLNSITGVVQGQQDDGGISALQPLGGDKFAASRFNFGDNYFLPNVRLASNAITSSIELNGNTFPELVANAPVKIERVTINGGSFLLFASNTKSNQVGMYFYDEATGQFASSRYVGFSNPYEVSSVHQTADGGLMISGTTYLAGRFPRIFLSRISKTQLAGQAR